MTQIVDVGEEIVDFSRKKRAVKFTMDGDTFECPPGLPVLSLMAFADQADRMDDKDLKADISKLRGLFQGMFELVLTDESAKRFIERLSDKENPIDLEQLQDVIDHIMGKFGMRPPQPSANSSDGQETPPSGLSLTGNAQPAGLISVPSPSPDS